ncbi:MAG: hypothetical protein CL920_39950 [Deltaproteobacteria bacterium]|nr:hypothetical protein [Deltaproteobacteria bacterium]MBU54910.1 hypothetical protein [Deltaproteobacteria bacterium]
MARLLKRRYTLFLGLMLTLGLLVGITGGCDCGGSPGTETITETNTENPTTDGGEVVAEKDGTCTQRCDCPQGQECRDSKCVILDAPVYCCDRDQCPIGKACLNADGSNGSCDVRTPCKHNCECSQGLACEKGYCTKTSKIVYCCEQSGCPAGEQCESIRGGTKTCGSEGSPCVSACGCVAGLACVNGQCTKSSTTVYCCDNTNCPEGQVCETAKGERGVCGKIKKCNSACDCPTGQACSNGRCVVSPVPVYCCDKPNSCPSGQACDTADGRRQTCPTQTECTQHCDCAQGQFCNKGACVVGTSPVYCCDKAGCPVRRSCFTKNGGVGTCPDKKCVKDTDCGAPSCRQQGTQCTTAVPRCLDDGSCSNEVSSSAGSCDPATGKCTTTAQCKVDCDCPQGQACSNGACGIANIVKYCCDKEGCPKGQACSRTDGSAGVCGGTTGCRSNAECGKTSCQQLGTDCALNTPTCDVATGKCVPGAQLVRNADCKTQNGQLTCVPRTGVVCKTHCDCPQGQGCSSGQCIGGTFPTYCCDKAGCPTKQACYNKDGTPGICPGVGGCKTDQDCGKASCRQSGTTCVVTKPTCDTTTGTCRSSSAASPGVCDPNTGSCTPLTPCQVHCDCPQGQACATTPFGIRVCQQVSTPVYCCDKAGCPSSTACFDKNNARGTCPITCTSPCDCNTGEDCVSGRCTVTPNPAYCCDDPQKCPAGAVCKDKSGKAGTCPQTQRPCKNVCDCVQGEACTNNVCVKTSNPTVFCCEQPSCPAGKACVNSLNQQGTCPVPCKNDCSCTQGQRCVNGTCTSSSGNGYCCTKSGCPANFSCTNPDGSRNRCPTQKCNSACDCNQGEDCRNGQCTRVFPAVYCCSKTGCPQGQSCKNAQNTWGTCPNVNTCSSPCDCPQGQDCFKGQCIQVFPSIYCCSKVGCQPGQACYDSNNKAGVCPGSQCTTSCDCPNQGQSCVRGRCASSNPRIYCCSKPGCQSGQSCEDTNGNLSVCPGAQCKTACDCNQGEDCRNGQCVRSSPAVYCCSKTACRAGQACVNTNGTSGTCPVQCKVDCDCPQGNRCSAGTCYPTTTAYCCSKAGCPTGRTCTTTTGQRSVCGGSTGQSCKVRCDCNQGEECVNGRCQQGPSPVYCCSKAGCPSNFVCQDSTGRTSFCPTTPPAP